MISMRRDGSDHKEPLFISGKALTGFSRSSELTRKIAQDMMKNVKAELEFLSMLLVRFLISQSVFDVGEGIEEDDVNCAVVRLEIVFHLLRIS